MVQHIDRPVIIFKLKINEALAEQPAGIIRRYPQPGINHRERIGGQAIGHVKLNGGGEQNVVGWIP